MAISQTGWPLVRTRFEGEVSTNEFAQWLRDTTELLQRGSPFVVITSSDDTLALPDGYRQQEGVWFKASKQSFGKHCLGIARIAISAEQYAHLNTPAMHKAWPCRYFVAMDEEQAMRWAAQLLAEQHE